MCCSKLLLLFLSLFASSFVAGCVVAAFFFAVVSQYFHNFNMSNPLEKLFDRVSAFVARTVLVENPIWRMGVAFGVTSSVLLNVFNNWNFNLSFTINMMQQTERLLFSFATPPFLIAETDMFRINFFRKFYTIIPSCSTQKMKTTLDIQIPSSEGHSIPATVYTPISQVCSEIKRPIIIHM